MEYLARRFDERVDPNVYLPGAQSVICVAINYVAHGKEGGLPTPPFPNLFARWYSTLVTSGTPVPVPAAYSIPLCARQR